MTLKEQMNFLIENCIATEEEVNIVIKINGYSEVTINDILYAKTGYRDIEQYLENLESEH